MSSEKPSLDALRIDRSARPQNKRPAWLLPLIIILLLALIGGAWLLFAPKPPEVQTTVALEQTGNNTTNPNATSNQTTLLNASGYITARRASTVSSKVTGKVTEVLIEEGMKVEKDQILAHIDATNVTASLRLAQAQLHSAKQAIEEIKPNLTFAQKELARLTGLVTAKAASTSDLNRAEAETSALSARLNKLTADITVAEREVDTWQQQVEDTIIRAPFTGIVTQKNAQPGEMISPMSSGGFTRTGICTIVDMDSLEIDVDVNESYINRVQPNQPVEAVLDSYPDWKIPAKVIAIIPTADRQKATVKVRVGIEVRDPRILPDMGVKVAFKSAPPKPGDTDKPNPTGPRLIIIPQPALRSINGRDIVWILTNGRAQQREVTVSQTNGDQSLISSGIASGETIIINAPSDLSEGSKVTEKKIMSTSESPLVHIHDVSKTFKRGSEEIHVLANLNLEVKKGEFLALMGPSGSGKSTLLNLIGGLDRATKGTVAVGDERIDQLSDRQLAGWRARHIGFIFQFYNLLPVLTAHRNVELPLLLTHLSKAERRQHAETALNVVGLAHRLKHYPRTMSGGEQQRVGIARAIVTDPTLLLCDEPTGDLDRKSGDDILTLLQTLNKEHGKTIIMVTHDPHASERATRTVHLDKGQLSTNPVT